MRTNARSDEAISPVVGVMLMLVVTIIIAAVVSAFAGGAVSGTKATPQVALQGTYSQANGMTITSAGGDAVALQSVDFMTTPSEMMGVDAPKFAWIVNKTIILDPANSNYPIYNQTGGIYNTTSFQPGDTLVVSYANCIDYNTTGSKSDLPNPSVNHNAQQFWSDPDNPGSKGSYFMPYEFGNPKNVGKYFYLDMVDSTGSIIARAKVTITG